MQLGLIKEIFVFQSGDYRNVEIERRLTTGESTTCRLNKYQVTEASMKRLHKAVSNAVNKGEAKIDLYERGYYAEF